MKAITFHQRWSMMMVRTDEFVGKSKLVIVENFPKISKGKKWQKTKTTRTKRKYTRKYGSRCVSRDRREFLEDEEENIIGILFVNIQFCQKFWENYCNRAKQHLSLWLLAKTTTRARGMRGK